MKVKVTDLLQVLVNTAEKGANIARIIRSDADLLNLLVEEKTGHCKNQRFVQDFKTLADVLVQEIVSHDLGEQIPDIKGSIHGEESNTFTNALGDSITVEIQPSRQLTIDLLCKVLDGNVRAAELLARVGHEAVMVDLGSKLDKLSGLDLDANNIGVWIDPIDSTAQYIGGLRGAADESGITSEGLQCVVVLIGVYDKETGIPLIGVTNQPFSTYDVASDRWTGATMWGVCVGDVQVNSLPDSFSSEFRATPTILMSTSESSEVKDLLKDSCSLRYASGAGYKFLCAILGLVDIYILSKSSTFKWDACGPHAILLSLGGGMISYSSLCNKDIEQLDDLQIRYHCSDRPKSIGAEKWCNADGIVAYQSVGVLRKISNIVRMTKH